MYKYLFKTLLSILLILSIYLSICQLSIYQWNCWTMWLFYFLFFEELSYYFPEQPHHFTFLPIKHKDSNFSPALGPDLPNHHQTHFTAASRGSDISQNRSCMCTTVCQIHHPLQTEFLTPTSLKTSLFSMGLVSHTKRHITCSSSKITQSGTETSKDPDTFWRKIDHTGNE